MFGSQRLWTHIKLVVICPGTAGNINALVAAGSRISVRKMFIEVAEKLRPKRNVGDSACF